ncbi:Protein of unknown function [Gryllus bimaculatus]|nr:Protein of unknown function [Gryllus bimaculatus]
MTAWVGALLAVAVATVVAATAAETEKAVTATAAETETADGVSTEERTAEGVSSAGAACPSAPAPIVSTSAPPQRLLINKCCKRHEQLDQEQKLCVAFQNATQADRDNRNQEQENWQSVRRRGQPPWLTRVVWTILNQNFSDDLVVRYNWRPCPFNLTSVKWSKEAHFFRNGSIKIKLWSSVPVVKKQYLLLSPAEYCVDQAALGKGYMAYLSCPCARVACVRKCCDHSRKLTLGQSVGMVQQAHCRVRRRHFIHY